MSTVKLIGAADRNDFRRFGAVPALRIFAGFAPLRDSEVDNAGFTPSRKDAKEDTIVAVSLRTARSPDEE
jgi:hypothetical protein